MKINQTITVLKRNSKSRNIVDLVCFWLLSVTLLFIWSCSSSTSTEVGSLSGQIELVNDTGDNSFDPIDFSGVTVALYPLAVLDTTIVRINHEYPNIGVQISQETEFDHRSEIALFETTTDALGGYSFSDVPVDTYNIAYIKNGWTINYQYRVAIASGIETEVNEVTLFHSIDLQGYISGVQTFKADHQYNIIDDTVFFNDITIEQNAWLAVTPRKGIKLYGNINTDSDGLYWKVLSSSNLYSTKKTIIDSVQYFYGVACYGEPVSISKGMFKQAISPLSILSSSADVSRCYFRDYNAALAVNQCMLTCSELLLTNGSSSGIQVLGIDQSTNISNCLFVSQNDAVSLYSNGVSTIENSYFLQSTTAIRGANSHGAITNNAFYGNKKDVYLSQSYFDISYNDFFYSREMCIYPWAVSQQLQSTVKFNNFYLADKYLIYLRAGSPAYTNVYKDLDATNNYWKEANIDQYILDAGDNEDFPNTECLFYAIYIPRAYNRINSAGIR